MKNACMKKFWIFILISSLSIDSYTQKTIATAEHGKVFISNKRTDVKPQNPPTPDRIWGKLFTDVQLKMVLGDNKTFVDAVPNYSPDVILKKYQDFQKSNDTAFKLKDFVFQNFKVPVVTSVKLPERNKSLKK